MRVLHVCRVPAVVSASLHVCAAVAHDHVVRLACVLALCSQAKNGLDGFYIAAQNGRLDVVKFFMAHGRNVARDRIDVNRRVMPNDASALDAAAEGGHLNVVT